MAENLIDETNTNLVQFSKAGHLANLAEVTPGNIESGGKHHPGEPSKLISNYELP